MPLGAGQLVDRFMATQRLLALTYAIGTGYCSSSWRRGSWLHAAAGCSWSSSVFWLVVGPAYSLCNSLAMRNLDDPLREFGWVRSWGTAGWMIAGWGVSLVMAVSGSTRAGQGAFEALWVGAVARRWRSRSTV